MKRKLIASEENEGEIKKFTVDDDKNVTFRDGRIEVTLSRSEVIAMARETGIIEEVVEITVNYTMAAVMKRLRG